MPAHAPRPLPHRAYPPGSGLASAGAELDTEAQLVTGTAAQGDLTEVGVGQGEVFTQDPRIDLRWQSLSRLFDSRRLVLRLGVRPQWALAPLSSTSLSVRESSVRPARRGQLHRSPRADADRRYLQSRDRVSSSDLHPHRAQLHPG